MTIRPPLHLPDWLDPALHDLVRELVEPILPDKIERPASPQAAVNSIARAAMRGYQAGRADAIHELLTSEQVAAQLGLSVQRVRALARSRDVGWRIGRDVLFRPEDVDAIRDRRPGRPPLLPRQPDTTRRA